MVVARGTHDDSQAMLVEADLKWFFDGEMIFALVLLVVLPVCDLNVHDALWIEGGTPEMRNLWDGHGRFPRCS